MMRIYEYVFVVCLFWIPNVSTEVKISEACNDALGFSQTHNLLECYEGTHICITEVRYYQWDPSDPVCRGLLSKPVPDRCCSGGTRCSWTINTKEDLRELQRNCTGQSRCDLLYLCFIHQTGFSYSRARSITYKCVFPATCPSPTTASSVTTAVTATSSGQTSAENLVNTEISSGTPVVWTTQPSPEETTDSTSPTETTPIIVGCVVAFIAVVGIIIITVVVVRKRSKKPNTNGVTHIAGSGSVPDMTPLQESSHSYYNIWLKNPDQQNQPNTRGSADDSKDEDLSPIYQNTAPEEDHAYTEMVENPYELTFTDKGQESNYTTLS